MSNIFETATRKAFRYTSNRGDLTTEQIWDLPLTSRSGFDLDSVAKAANAELKSVTEESFVATRVNPRKGDLETKLEILKHVIAVKIAEAEAVTARAAKQEKRAKILDALATKENEELTQASKDDLLKQLAELDA